MSLYRRLSPYNRRAHMLLTARVLLVVVALGMMGLLKFAFQAAYASDGEIDLRGTVVSAPDDPTGLGVWTMRSENNLLRQVVADTNTKIEKGVPQPGEGIEVKGQEQPNGVILASELIRLEGDGPGNEARASGHLLFAPAGGIGNWQIQTSPEVTQTVIANAATRLDNGVPAPGVWVEARGTLQANGSLLATRIRIDEHELQQVVVRLKTGVLSTTVASRYNLTPLSTLLASGNIYLFRTATADDEVILTPQIAADGDVLWAELNFVNRLPEANPYKVWYWGGVDSSSFVNQAAFDQVNLAPALETAQGNGVVVAILDTGIDLNHPALVDHLVSGWDMVADDATPQDEGIGFGWGHGTHIAGVIAHMAPASQLLPVRVLDSNGSGNSFTLAYGIEWAAAHGAHVINLSLGVAADSRVLQDTIQNVMAQGVIVVAAAGNANTNVQQFPASYPGVISVTAVDAANRKADFANYGDWVDLAAPGVGITSTIIGPLGSGYASWSGTSMAASFVSGAAALARQVMPTASAAQIAAQFNSHMQGLDNQNPTYQGLLGGLLDIGSTLANAPAITPTPIVTPTITLPVTPPTPTPAATPHPTVSAPTGTQNLYLPVIKG